MRRLRNYTKIADDVIREVEAFVMPPGGVASYDLGVKNLAQGSVRGMAYSEGSGYHDTARPFIVCSIGASSRFPRGPRPAVPGRGYLPQPWLASQEEALVFVLAHELRHLWQHRVPKGRRVWGARGQFSERDADAYAIRMLRRWRSR